MKGKSRQFLESIDGSGLSLKFPLPNGISVKFFQARTNDEDDVFNESHDGQDDLNFQGHEDEGTGDMVNNFMVEQSDLVYTLPQILSFYRNEGQYALRNQLEETYKLFRTNKVANEQVLRLVQWCKENATETKGGRDLLMDIHRTSAVVQGKDPVAFTNTLNKTPYGYNPYLKAMASVPTRRGRGGERGGYSFRGGNGYRGGGGGGRGGQRGGFGGNPNSRPQCSHCGVTGHGSLSCFSKNGKGRGGVVVPITQPNPNITLQPGCYLC